MKTRAPLFSDLMRPRQLGDLTLPKKDIARLQLMADTKSVMNMLFYGGPGQGKTSAARISMKSFPQGAIEIDGAKTTGVDLIKRVEGFSSSVSFTGDLKLCFIDEADSIHKRVQGALRKMIEDFSKNCRYIFAANERRRIIPAIRSRLEEISFDITPAERAEVQCRLIGFYGSKLSEIGRTISTERLAQIVGIYYPDFRKIASKLDFECAFTEDSRPVPPHTDATAPL
jgi:replication factor C subunit 3/5